MPVEIVPAVSDEQYDEVRAMLAEYADFIESHWPDVDRDAWALEIELLPSVYPLVLLATVDGEAAGCVMLREGTAEGACEVRRLFVRPTFRRHGVARALMERFMAEAGERGYERAQLVSVVMFTGAIPLYESMGFAHVEPFRPSTMSLEVVRFMERALQPRR